MNRVHTMAFRLLVASLVFWSCFAARTQAQTPSPSQESTKAPETKPANQEGGANPFAPEPAPPLPAGMTGSDANDSRTRLTPGMYDAGEASMGMKHLMLLKKPDAFQLGSADPDNPKVQRTLGLLGVGDSSKMPKPMQVVIAQLAFANSDLAFQGNHLFQGNFYGVNVYDISNPAKTTLLTSMVCPGGQGDLSVYKNLLFMSVEMPNGRLDCGTQGFPPGPQPPAGGEKSRPCRQRKKIVSGVLGFSILRTSRILSRWPPCKLAAARTRIRWWSIRMIRTTYTSTSPERLSSAKVKSWPAARVKHRRRTRIRRCFALM